MDLIVIALSVSGGSCELAGLALVVLEIRGDRKLAERYTAQVRDAPPPGFQGSLQRPEVRLMNDFNFRHADPATQIKTLKEGYDRDIARITQAASRSVYEERRRFESFVTDILQGGLTQRKLGAALIGLGIVLGSAANVAGAL